MSRGPRLHDFPPPARVVVVAPHPDDETLGCGGCIALHRMQGDPVTVIVVFDGALGADGPDGATRREAECRAAARELLDPDLEFWRLPEGHAPSTHDMEAATARLAARFSELRAERVYAPWPGDDHPDHRAVASCVQAALARLGADAPEAWGFEVWSDHSAPIVVDVSAAHERKLRALACHASQSADGALEAACRSRLERRARVFQGRASGAEAFAPLAPEAQTVKDA